MEIDFVKGEMFCQYCNIWQKVEKIKFSKEGIDVECAVCHVTTCYNIKQDEDVK